MLNNVENKFAKNMTTRCLDLNFSIDLDDELKYR